MSKHAKVWAIVPAAGIGQRMGQERPKQYLMIQGKPILAHTLARLAQVPDFEQIIIALHPEDTYWQSLDITDPRIQTVIGGTLRFESVLNALKHLESQAQPSDWILVHDAVRPCITAPRVMQLLAEIKTDPVGGLWGVPVRDTLKQVDNEGRVLHTVPREILWHALTPQIFRFELLYRALQKAKADHIVLTDEASAIEYLGYHPKMVQGDYSNIKITWPEDLAAAAYYLQD
ncbi:MAG TPA: 2-C-methyl-D-erythritol 4-phosphate cytidylyltransferase [Gammaproteobacteria bacterium]|nr:2-C-methyl-D-erythritol 4-phosphate cytidylyltransferase [Gammaproteobacteria bacterium]